MTRQKIEQYTSLLGEIKMLEEDMRSANTNLQPVVDWAYDYSRGFPKPITLLGFGQNNIPALSDKLAKKITEANEIERFIDCVPDSLMRQILVRRYLKGQSVDDTAAQTGYSARQVKRYTANFFKKLSPNVP